MPAITIRNVPDELVARLKERAARNHRSLQGELRAIFEEAARHYGLIQELQSKAKASDLQSRYDPRELPQTRDSR